MLVCEFILQHRLVIYQNDYLKQFWISANCPDGALRLVGGSTDREGRVEVCVGGRRWRTVCNGSQLGGAVCSQMGYIFEGKRSGLIKLWTLWSTNRKHCGKLISSWSIYPEHKLNCTQLSNGTWHCSPVEQQCDSFAELGVVCINYEEFYERSRDSTLSTQLPPVSSSPDNDTGTEPVGAENSTTFIAGIGVLVALLLAVSVGWTVSCVILLRRGHTVHKQQ